MWADQYLVPFAIDFVIAIIVFVTGRWVARAITRTMAKLMSQAKVEESLTTRSQRLFPRRAARAPR